MIGEIPAKFGVLPQALPSSELLTQIAISKCVDHLPWYRQEKILTRSLCELPRQSMCDWMQSLAVVVKPLYSLIKTTLFTKNYLQGDETTIPLKIKNRNRKERRTIQRYMWSIFSPELKMVFFHFGDRSAKTAKKLYEGYKGFLQTDHYSGYNDLLNIIRLACLAHCRRKFIESDESIAQAEVLNIFQDIYKIEADIKGADSKLRQQVRNTQTRAKFAELKLVMERIVLESIETKSKIVQACHYSLNQWDDIERILENEKFLIDNNTIEQTNRPFALGRKNWLFVCSLLGGETLAILCTILHSAQLCGLNIFEYFNDVITRIADHPISKLHELLPCNWVAPKIATANST
jgi:IS1 family transposase